MLMMPPLLLRLLLLRLLLLRLLLLLLLLLVTSHASHQVDLRRNLAHLAPHLLPKLDEL